MSARPHLGAAVLCAVALLAVACGDQPTSRAHVASPEPTVTPSAPAAPYVVRWGRLGRLVSAEVRNPNTDVGLVATSVRLVLRDALGAVVAAREAGLHDTCCMLFRLAPGATHGLYADAGPDAERVRSVDVEVREPDWQRWPAAAATAAFVPARVRRVAAGTYVDGRLTVRGARDFDIAVQVSLESPDGELVAVVSALLGCFRTATARPVRLELFHAVPAGTRAGPAYAAVLPAGRFAGGDLQPC